MLKPESTTSTRKRSPLVAPESYPLTKKQIYREPNYMYNNSRNNKTLQDLIRTIFNFLMARARTNRRIKIKIVIIIKIIKAAWWSTRTGLISICKDVIHNFNKKMQETIS